MVEQAEAKTQSKVEDKKEVKSEKKPSSKKPATEVKKKGERARRLSVSADPTKLDEPVSGDAALEKEEITVQSRIAGTSTTDNELTRSEMIEGIRSVADEMDMPVSIIITDALKRDDAVQFDDASDEEVAYIYKKYVHNMIGDE